MDDDDTMEDEGAFSGAAADDGGGERATLAAVRRMSRERLLRYVAEVIELQTTPLRDVIRDHALHHLPAQSLLRLRSVSASWNRRISNPFFVHTHSHARRSLSGLFFFSGDGCGGRQLSYLPFDRAADAIPDPSLSFLPGAIDAAASSGGLLACRSRATGGGAAAPCYYVCNPATAQWTTLPRPPSPHHPHGAALAFIFCPSALDFSPRYHLLCPVLHPQLCFEVFSSDTGQWRLSGATRNIPQDSTLLGPAVAAGGVAYWQTTRHSVVSYDPATNVLCGIGPLPLPAAGTSPRPWRLGEMDGRLCCMATDSGIVEVHVLVLSGCGRSSTWTKLGCFEVEGCLRALALEGTQRRVLVSVNRRVVAIELATGRMAVVHDYRLIPLLTGEVVPYSSSLVSVPAHSPGAKAELANTSGEFIKEWLSRCLLSTPLNDQTREERKSSGKSKTRKEMKAQRAKNKKLLKKWNRELMPSGGDLAAAVAALTVNCNDTSTFSGRAKELRKSVCG